MIPGTHEYDTIASDGTNPIFVPWIRLNASISTAAHHYRGDERSHDNRYVSENRRHLRLRINQFLALLFRHGFHLLLRARVLLVLANHEVRASLRAG